MGLFNKRHIQPPTIPDTIPDMATIILEKVGLQEPKIQLQVYTMVGIVIAIAIIRWLTHTPVQSLAGKRTVDLSALNDAIMYKEVFMTYLGAALLEPVMAIAAMEEAGQELIINIFTLASICWWTWMVTDGFDYADICQSFKYHVDLREEAKADPKRYSWLLLSPKDEDAASERRTLAGSYKRDIALWFCLASIAAAWLPGPVTHGAVMHAYAIVFSWSILHHSCRRATTWGPSYIVTYIFPSAALMPMEYCMPLMDTNDFVEDLELVERYRNFVMERTGVELIIKS